MPSLLLLSGSTQGAHTRGAGTLCLGGVAQSGRGVSSLSTNLQMIRNLSKDGNREQCPYRVTGLYPSWDRNEMLKTW